MRSDATKELAVRKALVALNPEAVETARAAIPTDELLAVVVEAFQALGDPTRARILYALGTGPLCVRDLAILVGGRCVGSGSRLNLLHA
jgi:ArsR family transcriptional regulator, lead/cadmium/zinc/bismuth-responsive transcriptional repressor